MRRRLTRLLLAGALAGLALGPADAALELPGQDVINSVKPAVLRVEARDCADGQSRTGTGFLFEAADQVVTALHVVAGCDRLAVFHQENEATVRARIERSVAGSDLALLKLANGIEARPLFGAETPLVANHRMLAFGYKIGQPTRSDTELRLTSGSARLRDMLNDEARRAVQAAGLPSLDLSILRLDGHLLPGLSGAPIIDASGKVVGVGDGGLEGGAVSISWGIPASELARLKAAPESAVASVDVRRAAPLFAADIAANPSGAVIVCGERSFRLLRTRQFADLAATTDSPLTVQQFVAAMQQAGINPSAFSYDIYVEERSGAAVAIPAGWSVESDPEDGYCFTGGPSSGTEMRFVGQTVRDLFDAEAKVIAFENMVVDEGLYQAQIDPNWTYPSAYIRPDGLIVNRKSAGLFPVNTLSGLSAGYGMETLLVREDLFVGVVAYDRSPCRYQPYAPECNPAQPVHIEFVQAAVGAALSTMPCGPAADAAFVEAFAGPAAKVWPNAFCTGG